MGKIIDGKDPKHVWNRKTDSLDRSMEMAGKFKLPIIMLVVSAMISPTGNFVVGITGALIGLFGWALPVPQIGNWELFIVLGLGSLALVAFVLIKEAVRRNAKTESEDRKVDKILELSDIPMFAGIAVIHALAGWVIAVKILLISGAGLVDLVVLSVGGYFGLLAFLASLERTGVFEWAKQHERHL